MRYSGAFVFGSPHSTFCLAVRHVSSLKTCLTAQRTLPNRGTVSHLSQLDTCQTPTAELIFATPILQKRRSRSLVHAKTRHNFLTIFYNKVSCRPISLGPLSVDFVVCCHTYQRELHGGIAMVSISWLSVLYVLNSWKVTVWILYRYEMAKI